MEKIVNEKIKYTPMMEQYLEIKKDYSDAIVFFRLGDFYEMFFEDAYKASRELEIVLTGRDAGQTERVPMCGIPFHAYQTYVEKLVNKGYKVAIVEQVEDPSLAKGIVKREVVKLITPGTIIESGLNDRENNYIVSISKTGKEFILCYADVSTGEIYTTILASTLLLNEILSLKAKEIIVSKEFNTKVLDSLRDNYQIVISYENNTEIPNYLQYILNEVSDKYHSTIGILINYILETQKRELSHLKTVKFYQIHDYMNIDPYTRRNLELTETLRNGQKSGSLLYHLDHCSTAMGSRMLRRFVEKPLISLDLINDRLDFIEELNSNYISKEEIKNSLKNVYDIERILGRISCGNANAKDLVQLRKSLSNIPLIKNIVSNLNLKKAKDFALSIDQHSNLFNLLEVSLVENPPLTIKEGNMILEGYNSDLDDVKSISKNSKEWIVNYESLEKERLGIKTLKVGYNRVFGYYIEISKGQASQIPDNSGYVRRQTIANSERYITPELKVYEQKVLNAKDKIENLEYEIFQNIRNEAQKYISSLQKLADSISILDCYISLSEISLKNNYVRPTFNNNHEINIVDGRHPVLETYLLDNYVYNDIIINKYNMMLITGPNMSGKSTYMRMLALIATMAQMGSFVPARVANLPIFDSIFTRIGASDDLISGQSTFMVEMLEANYALANATVNSLILFDELGRGTATYDGMALAQAILEYVHEKIGCITLFSTHYHELVQLEKSMKKLKNVHVEAKETKNGVAFLHRVKDGPIDKSYGINVASLANLPKSLIERSKIILNSLESDSISKNISLDLFNFEAYENKSDIKEEILGTSILKDLENIDVNLLTPIEALNILFGLKEKIKN